MLAKALISVCTLTGAMHAFAATNKTNNAPLIFSANQSTYNRQAHTMTYIGNVKMHQGKTRLHADKVVLTLNPKTSKVSQLIANGKPAYYSTIERSDKKRVKCWGNTIIYTATNQSAWLIGNAKIKKPGSSIRGERLHYNLRQGKLMSLPHGQGRHTTSITIQTNQ